MNMSIGGLGRRMQDTDWTQFNPTIDGATANPTQGATRVTNCWYRRQRSDLLINFYYRQSAAGTAGTGVYKFKLPGDFSLDTTKITVGVHTSTATTGHTLGNGTLHIQGTEFGPCSVIAYDATSLALHGFADSANNYNIVGSTWYELANANIAYIFTARVPILG